MITKANYLKLKEKFSNVASWAIREEPTNNMPKSNMRNISMFERDDILEILNPNYVFIALNGSGVHDNYMDTSKPWHNFHSSNPRGHDYKLRYALKGTQYWGAYITDAIKFLPEVDSQKVAAYLNDHPNIVTENMKILEKEIDILGSNPILICLGNKSYDIVKKQFGNKYTVKKVMHYSFQIGKEKYREQVLNELSLHSKNTELFENLSLPQQPPKAILKPNLSAPIKSDTYDAANNIPSLEQYLRLTALDIPMNWKGDNRDRLISLFDPIIKGTDFHIEKNMTDTTKNGLNLFYKNASRRCMGFGKMKNMSFLVYPTKLFYDEISYKTPLPETDPKKSQPHMKMSLIEFWDFLYKITR